MNDWEERFGTLPELGDSELGGLTDDQMKLCDWDTTPKDLRDDDEKTLGAFCKKQAFSVAVAMKWMQLRNYKLTRRALSREKGEFDHKTRSVLEALYEEAIGGSVNAIREYNRLEGVSMDIPSSEAEPEDPEEPKTSKEMTVEELEALVNGTSNS